MKPAKSSAAVCYEGWRGRLLEGSLGSGVPYLNTFFLTCSLKEPL